MKYRPQRAPEAVHEAAIGSVSHARNLRDDVERLPQDGSCAEPDFPCRTVESATGAGTVDIADTVGCAVPEEFAALAARLHGRVPNVDQAVVSVPCCNDPGVADANALAAVGNRALEAVVMARRTRHGAVPRRTGANIGAIARDSHPVSIITGFRGWSDKAAVGASTFAHEAGIHRDGVPKHAGTRGIMTPESAGSSRSKRVRGEHSGRRAFREKPAGPGFTDLGDNAVEAAVVRFRELADKKKEVFRREHRGAYPRHRPARPRPLQVRLAARDRRPPRTAAGRSGDRGRG